jgi:tetratricopeptide (TPR) repeat protein
MAEYHFARYHYKPRRRKRKVFLTLLILLLIGGGVVYAVFFVDFYSLYANVLKTYRLTVNDYSFIEKNLDLGHYNIAIQEGMPYLEKKPNNQKLLRYMGESYYYISLSLTGSEMEESLDHAILYLRKGIALSTFEDILAKPYYVLGMAYFKKGGLNYELAAEYLERAVKAGYEGEGVYEVLGYCFYKLGALDSAVRYLEKAQEEAPTDVSRLYLAFAYKDQKKYESALKELHYLTNNTSDDVIYEEAYDALVWIDFQEERYDSAREGIAKILAKNENSAFAHYWLGNIYEMEGDLISARNEWRKALKIDPSHIGAIEKLY